MTKDEESKCETIIHSAALAAGGVNALPLPTLGIAADMTAMTLMVVSLAGVFGGDMSTEMARGIAIAALKKTMLKQPIKVLTKELSKLIPGVGQIVAPTISIVLVEAAGWNIAKSFDEKRNKKM